MGARGRDLGDLQWKWFTLGLPTFASLIGYLACRSARTEVEDRYNKYQAEWSEFESKYHNKENEFKHMQEQEHNHAKCAHTLGCAHTFGVCTGTHSADFFWQICLPPWKAGSGT